MKIIFYKNSAEQNRMDKTDYIEEVLSIEGTLRDNTSIVNPTIVVQTSGLISANYAYIEEFNRYYFINDIVAINLFLYEISMTCDVLMTYKNNILSLPALVSRNQSVYNEYISDDRAPLQNNNEVSIDIIAKIFNADRGLDGQYLLVVNNNSNSFIRGSLSLPEPLNSLSATSVTSCRGFTTYLISDIAFQAVSSICFNNENYTTGIISCIALPFKVDTSNSNETTPIRINGEQIQSGESLQAVGYDLSLSSNADLAQKCLVYSSLEFSIGAHENNFRDYEPYTEYSIYIPYLGWRDLNAIEVVNHILQLVYVINPTSASANVFLITNANNILLNEECQLGVSYEFTVTNLKQLEDQRLLLNANLLTGINSATSQAVSGLLTGAAGVATQNPQAIASGGANIYGAVVSGVNAGINYSAQMATLHNKANCTPSSGFNGTISPQSIMIRRAKTIIPVYENNDKYDKYLSLNGRPLNETRILNELSGYTEVLNIHLDNISNALKIELDMISQILSSGFII